MCRVRAVEKKGRNSEVLGCSASNRSEGQDDLETAGIVRRETGVELQECACDSHEPPPQGELYF